LDWKITKIKAPRPCEQLKFQKFDASRRLASNYWHEKKLSGVISATYISKKLAASRRFTSSNYCYKKQLSGAISDTYISKILPLRGA
jgi:hypothetical protein